MSSKRRNQLAVTVMKVVYLIASIDVFHMLYQTNLNAWKDNVDTKFVNLL